MPEAPVDRLLAEAQARVGPLAARGDWSGVARIAEALAHAAPTSPEAWLMLSHARVKMGRFAEACDAAEEAYRLQAPTPDELVYVARLAMFANDLPRGNAALERAEAAAPEHAAVLAARALYFTYIGRNEDAEACCLKSIEADPGRMDAWPQLSLIRSGRLTKAEEALLRQVVDRAAAPPQAQISARHVLAHSLDARGAVDAAFAEYMRANALAYDANSAEGHRFNRAAYDRWTQRIIDTFTGARDIDPLDPAVVTPLFIVGLPRSGSTLVESVLAAHSKVDAGGEAEMLPRMFIRWMKETNGAPRATLTPVERRRFAETYDEGAGAIAGATFFTDKNLNNIEAVGFIAELFPRAKIINVRRAPMEAGLGIFRQKFRQFWPWTTRLEDIGARIGQIARLVRHWESAYPERFLTIQYETFTDEFEAGVRRLLDFCGLDFDPACLAFYEAERAVVTLSSAQVREPVKKRAGKAAAYGAHLEPLRIVLERQGVDLDTGALKE